MAQELDKDFWEGHWQQADATDAAAKPNPHLQREIDGLTPGTALDAGCGEGVEAIWLATQGWQVTAADISATALSRAAEGAEAAAVSVAWVEADVSVWEPGVRYDLVTTHYAHPEMPQPAFYERISEWVAPGGTLLIVGHLRSADAAEREHGDHPFEEASVTVASVAAVLDEAQWDVVTAEEHTRIFRDVPLRDVVVRALRR